MKIRVYKYINKTLKYTSIMNGVPIMYINKTQKTKIDEPHPCHNKEQHQSHLKNRKSVASASQDACPAVAIVSCVKLWHCFR